MKSLSLLALGIAIAAFNSHVNAQSNDIIFSELKPSDKPIVICRIPDDCIDSKRYPLFIARAVLKELIESLQSTQGVKPC